MEEEVVERTKEKQVQQLVIYMSHSILAVKVEDQMEEEVGE